MRKNREWRRTNLSKTFNAINAVEDGSVKSHYFPGVGTKFFERFRGGVLGIGLRANLREGYAWLVEHYSPSDRLYLFGYSRGAYTARSLAGLIDLCGLPGTGYMSPKELARKALKVYRIRNADKRKERARDFRAEHVSGSSSKSAREEKTQVWFVGVWDTVGALGIPINGLDFLLGGWRDQFHNVRLGESVVHGYHAVAIDETRRPYVPTLWDHPPKGEQRVEQVWFPGVHGDVGGDTECDALSDLALRWMWGKASEAGLSLDLAGGLGALAPNPHGPLNHRRPLIHRLTRYVRPIGRLKNDAPASACEAVHFSAYERRDCECCEYGTDRIAANFADAAKQRRVQQASLAWVERPDRLPPPEARQGEDSREPEDHGGSEGESQLKPAPDREPDRRWQSPLEDLQLHRHGGPNSPRQEHSERSGGVRALQTVVLRRLGGALAAARRGIAAIAFGVACLLVSVLVGVLAFAAVYRYIRPSEFLVTAAALVSFAVAFQFIFLFGQRLVEVLGRVWDVLCRTVRDVGRALRESRAD